MWVTIVDTDSYSWVTLGRTRKESRAAWSEGFRRHMADRYAEAVDDWIEVSFGGEAPIDFYNARSFELKTGDCLRDGVPV